MTKVLLMTAWVIVVAGPARAGLTPEWIDPASSTLASGAAGRSAAYAPNDADHVYDMMTSEVLGPEELVFQLTQNPASGAFCNLIHLRPGATSISSIHIVIDQRLATAAWTLSIAFRNDLDVYPHPIGSFLTTESIGSHAWYVFSGMPFGGPSPTLFQFSLGSMSANVTQSAVWTCLQANQPFRVRTGDVTGNEQHGNPGDGTPTSLYIGSGSGVFASVLGIGSASLMTSFTIAAGAGQPGNWHMALGGAPEPATIGLLALGLLALRRRRAREVES